MSPQEGRVATTHASARGPTDTRPAPAAWRRLRRWPRFPARTVGRLIPALIQILSRACHRHVPARFVQITHLAEQREKVVLPVFALAPHLDAVWRDEDATGHPARQLFDVEVALRIDADNDVVPIGNDAAKAQTLATQLDPKRVRKVVELGRPGPVPVFERPQYRFQLLLSVRRGELTVSAEPLLLVANVRARDEVIERQVEVNLRGGEDVADRGLI